MCKRFFGKSVKKSIFRHICIIVSLFIWSNATYAKTNITDKLKQAIQTLGDKVHNAINVVKHKVEKGEVDTQVKQKHKSKIKIQKIIVHLPPPDAEIFKKYPIDITMSRPTVVSNNGMFIVNDVWIYEKTGDTPFVKPETIQKMIEKLQNFDCIFLGFDVSDITQKYGRFI